MSNSEIIGAAGLALSALVVFIRYGIPAMIRYIAVRIGLALEEARERIIRQREWSRYNGEITLVSLSEAATEAHIPLKMAKWAVRRHKIRKRMLKWK